MGSPWKCTTGPECLKGMVRARLHIDTRQPARKDHPAAYEKGQDPVETAPRAWLTVAARAATNFREPPKAEVVRRSPFHALLR